MSGVWHMHAPYAVRRDDAECALCTMRDMGTPVLVVDLAGAREQIARAVHGGDDRAWAADTRGREMAFRSADRILAALGAPEEGEV